MEKYRYKSASIRFYLCGHTKGGFFRVYFCIPNSNVYILSLLTLLFNINL